MKPRTELYKSPGYWLEIIQNELFRQVYDYMERENLNQSQLAERLGITKGRITQILSGDANFTFKKLIEVSLKIGIVPDIQFKSIAQYTQEEEMRLHLAYGPIHGSFTADAIPSQSIYDGRRFPLKSKASHQEDLSFSSFSKENEEYNEIPYSANAAWQMAEENKQVNLTFSVKRIKELEYFVTENDEKNDSNIGFNFQYVFNDSPKENLVTFTIVARLISREEKRDLVRIKLATTYLVENLEHWLTDAENRYYDFPIDFVASLLGIAFSHVRGVLAIKTAGTRYENFIIPVINPKKVLEDN